MIASTMRRNPETGGKVPVHQQWVTKPARMAESPHHEGGVGGAAEQADAGDRSKANRKNGV